MKRILLTALLAPLLLAPVRLKDATPGFFQGEGSLSPAPEAFSLPAAEPLTTPTVIQVSPTFLPAPISAITPTAPSPTSLNLPLPPSPTVVPVQKVIVVQPVPDLMPVKSAALCIKGMQLTQSIAMLSYGQKRNQATMTLALAASAAAGEASNRTWPNLTAFNNAADDLPWFQPQKTELHDALTAAQRLCAK